MTLDDFLWTVLNPTRAKFEQIMLKERTFLKKMLGDQFRNARGVSFIVAKLKDGCKRPTCPRVPLRHPPSWRESK